MTRMNIKYSDGKNHCTARVALAFFKILDTIKYTFYNNVKHKEYEYEDKVSETFGPSASS